MNYSRSEAKLIEAMKQMPVIDCHEHLPPENEITAQPQDVFTLFSGYTKWDLFSAGMDRKSFTEPISGWDANMPQYNNLFDRSRPLEKRWELFRPYWRLIRYGSYARAALLTAKMIYGVDDINDQTYQFLSERVAAESTPGIYERILCEQCGIKAVMTQCWRTDVDRPLVPIMNGGGYADFCNREQMEKNCAEIGAKAGNLDDYMDFLRKLFEKWLSEGIIGIKIASVHNEPSDRSMAEGSFKRLLDGQELQINCFTFRPTRIEPLHNFLLHYIIDLAAELDLIVAVHSGMWFDYRKLDCKNMLSLASAHPKTDFDLYHLGMPDVRDALMVAKNLPNVFLNLCWTHIISQAQVCSAIDEMLDEVPVNKILGFAKVFASRIDRGMMALDDAVEILKMWFWKNPLDLYRRLKI